MSSLFPAVEPYDSGLLDVGDGHRVYWESCGNPSGRPALFLHGGPGSGCSPGQRRFFDPDVYRAVLFDQRGAGRSRPLASEPEADLSTNTTSHLIADIEALRRHLGVESWTMLGFSWGTTLGLAYAQAHPDRVDRLVLALVTNTSRREVEWLTEGVARIFPQQWEHFAAAVPDTLRHLRLVMRTPRSSSMPTRPYASTPRANGVPGRRPTSRSRPATGRIRATKTPSSASASRGW